MVELELEECLILILNKEYALPEIKIYGILPASFQNSVLSWSAENQKI
mgnify:CR=1 FL=1